MDDNSASAVDPIVMRFAKTRPIIIRYVEDRLSAILRELSRFRSYYVAWEAFDERGYTSYDDISVQKEFAAALQLAEAYYRQFRASDEIVAPLPLYYGSMWLARAVIALYSSSQELGSGLYTHGLRAQFPDLESGRPEGYFEELQAVLAGTSVHFSDRGRLSILSEMLDGDDLSGRSVGLAQLISCVPELGNTIHARIYPRDDDYSGIDPDRGVPLRCGFDYRLPEGEQNPMLAKLDEFSVEFPLAPAFSDRGATIGMRQVHFTTRGDQANADLRMLTVSTPDGLFLERRLSTGEYIPEMAAHLAIQHTLSELVRYHPLVWLAMIDSNTEEYAMVREFLDVTSRKFPLLVLNELSWSTYEFRRV